MIIFNEIIFSITICFVLHLLMIPLTMELLETISKNKLSFKLMKQTNLIRAAAWTYVRDIRNNTIEFCNSKINPNNSLKMLQ